jgi:pyruvate dehydrogenase E2 component (dihydrolipoamide acetyltransferase)|tara:strand:- start:485 stop:1759 length:1275 start_codon:yes stop_codon:yes gene_type:complete
MNKKIIYIPDLGEAEDVEVIEICVKPGDEVGSEDPIIVLESDKAAMEVPASHSGKIISINVSNGDKVTKGVPFLEIEVNEEKKSIAKIDSSNADKEIKENKIDDDTNIVSDHQPPSSDKINSSTGEYSNKKVYAGPAVRKLAREFGIQLSAIRPTGPRGRIQKEDLHEFVKTSLSSTKDQFQFSQPRLDFSKWGSIKEVKLSKFQKTALNNLHTSWINIPHVTQHDEFDVTLLMELRERLNKKHKLKISPLAFIAKIVVNLLAEFPLLNCSLNQDMESITLKEYINLGIAVDTPNGLIVPYLKNAQEKSIKEISEEISLLAEAAKSRKLKPTDLKGASFSISSLGAIGGKFFTPIINSPEVAILGISKTYKKVVEVEKNFEARDYLPISLSYDHRVINGVYAVQFTSRLGQALLDLKLIEESFI